MNTETTVGMLPNRHPTRVQSSTGKGNALESRVFASLKTLIARGGFFVSGDNCRVYRKRSYMSQRTHDPIVFDVAIEVFLPGKTTYSLLVLVECKNHRRPVEIGDIQKFIRQIEDVSGANVKGIVASTHSFQDGARKEAASAGIGLLRYYTTGYKWELTRSLSSMTAPSASSCSYSAIQGITTESFVSDTYDCLCSLGDVYTASLGLFLWTLARSGIDAQTAHELGLDRDAVPVVRTAVRFVRLQAIEATCQRVLRQIQYSSGEVSLEEVCTWLRRAIGLRVTRRCVSLAADGRPRVLGRIRFSPPRITVTRYAAGSAARQRFTLAHELGHLLLGHSRYMISEECSEADLDVEKQPDIGVEDISRMEWQAQHFASCLLLPKEHVKRDLLELVRERGLHDRGFGTLYVDRQESNIRDYYAITSALMTTYGVSRQAVTIRLKELGLLIDDRTASARPAPAS